MPFSLELMEEANVAVSPGIGFGEEGEGYLRLALVENDIGYGRRFVRSESSCAVARAGARGRKPRRMPSIP